MAAGAPCLEFLIITRFGYLDEETVALLAKASFRFVLVGLEAAAEEALKRLNKGCLPHQAYRNQEVFTR